MPTKIVPRLSQERGHADHGWLKTFHTFSFANYQDFQHDSFGCLRVINEDRVDPKTGFGTHAHREFEIFSYIVDGELEHRDSMGNVEVLKRGDLQMTSAGTGIQHSEYQHGAKQVHFLQIWAVPSQSRLRPQYYTRHFTDEEKKDRWCRVVAPVGAADVNDTREAKGPAPVHAPIVLSASILSQGTKLTHTLPKRAGPRKAYFHVIQRSGYNVGPSKGARVRLSGADGATTTFGEGDGAYIMGDGGAELSVENVGDVSAEVLLFDIDF